MTELPAKPRKQEQEPATDQITEVAPNVLRSELPIQLPGLGHVNMYLLEDERGVAVVDPGLPEKASYAAVAARLKAAGYPLSRVHTIVITHSHHDHYGGAAWLQEQAGGDARIITHRDFRMMWEPIEAPDIDVEDFAEIAGEATLDGQDQGLQPERRYPWDPPPWGGPAWKMPLKRRLMFHAVRRFPVLARRLPRPTHRLDEAQTIRLARREWTAIHTPGHTNDHLCLFDPEEGCMLCGDHVLPTITPHIGGMGGRSVDPLAAFFDSLDKMAAFGDNVRVALPAHGKPFADLAGRAEAIKEHHVGRLELLRTTSESLDRPATVMEMSTHLFSPRAQGVMADSETFAHLEYLRLRHEMDRTSVDGVFEYTRVD